MKRKYSSIPFIPLKAKDRNKAVENEIILDTDNNKIYIQKDDTVDLLSGLEERLSNDKEESTEYGITINMKEPDPSNAITYTEYAEGFRAEKTSLLDKVLSQKEEAPVSSTSPDQKTISIVTDKDFAIDSLDPNS